MKILITGGAGYIGSVLVGKLLGWTELKGDLVQTYVPYVDKLTVIDSLRYNQNTMGTYMVDPRFNFVLGDVDNEALMLPLYEEHDVIIPLAGLVGFPECAKYPQLAWDLNMSVIGRMLDHINGVGQEKKIVFPCTNSGYGNYPDGRFVTEEDPLNPISIYGKSKVRAEELIRSNGGVSLRLATVMGYSPFMRVGLLVNTFCWKAVKDRCIVLYEKKSRRNYIHVEDVCNAFILALEKYDTIQGKAYNVGLSTANLNKEDLAKKIAEYTEVHILEAPFMKDPDQRDYLVSNAKIEALGFKPQWTLDATIQHLLKFYTSVSENSGNIYFGTT
jgi:nucleoside-diphosphate-sugar epimerase